MLDYIWQLAWLPMAGCFTWRILVFHDLTSTGLQAVFRKIWKPCATCVSWICLTYDHIVWFEDLLTKLEDLCLGHGLNKNICFLGSPKLVQGRKFAWKVGICPKKTKNNRNTTHMHSAIVSVQPILFETQGQVLTLTAPWNLKTPSNTTSIDSPNLELYGYTYVSI